MRFNLKIFFIFIIRFIVFEYFFILFLRLVRIVLMKNVESFIIHTVFKKSTFQFSSLLTLSYDLLRQLP